MLPPVSQRLWEVFFKHWLLTFIMQNNLNSILLPDSITFTVDLEFILSLPLQSFFIVKENKLINIPKHASNVLVCFWMEMDNRPSLQALVMSRSRRKVSQNVFKRALSSDRGLLGWDPSSWIPSSFVVWVSVPFHPRHRLSPAAHSVPITSSLSGSESWRERVSLVGLCQKKTGR